MTKKLISGIVLAAVIALLLWFASPSYRQGEPSVAGSTAPDFTFELNGQRMRLADLRGKVVVLNFWATWCPPCVEEMPSLNLLHEQIAPSGGMVLGISVDDDAAAYEKFLKDHGIRFATYRNPSREISSSYGTFMYPETFIIDQKGRIARKVIGPQQWDSTEHLAYLRTLLKRD